MGQQDRDRFVKQTNSERKIPIDRLNCRNLPDKNEFELIHCGRQVFTIDEFATIMHAGFWT